MPEYRINGYTIAAIKARHAGHVIPLARSLAIMNDIIEHLKAQGMRFVDDPNGFFKDKRPEAPWAHWLDINTDEHVYWQGEPPTQATENHT